MTAVEQLELRLLGIISFDSEELKFKYKKEIQRAKEMENKQMIEMHHKGFDFDMKEIVEPQKNKLELEKILDILYKIKDDSFYFKEYGKDIISSFVKQEQHNKIYSEEEVLNFTQTMLMQYKFGNTNIEQLDLLKESFEQFKNK